MARCMTLMAASLAAVLAAGCTPAADKAPAAAAATGAVAPVERNVATIAEAFLTPMTPADNIDSPASWQA
ncbi:MAG: phytase, partial [Stenotrophomonas indicatrix]